MTGTAHKRKQVVIAGGGVAALETVLALRSLAGHVLDVTLVTPERDFLYRPVTVAEAFGRGEARSYSVSELVGDTAAARVLWDTLAEVLVDEHVAVTGSGERLAFDSLVIATGGEPRPPLPGALTFRGRADVPELERLLDDLTSGRARSVAFALTPEHSWPLPLYELALMTASHLRAHDAHTAHGAEIRLVTPESRPLELFGEATADEIEPLLHARGIEVLYGAVPASIDAGTLLLAGGERVPAKRLVTLPVLTGRPIPGLPCDGHGFHEVDAHGRMNGLVDVYAAGDVTAFPLKQGGLAAEQADAVAEAIAAAAGVAIRPRPFVPVLRGLLLTGGAPIYMRSELHRDRRRGVGMPSFEAIRTSHSAPRTEASGQPLWWPPAKVAGRYLAPYLATARPDPLRLGLLKDRSSIPGEPLSEAEHDDAVELALLLAECDARWGDYASALAALDTAFVLNGALTPELEAKRRAWTDALQSAH